MIAERYRHWLQSVRSQVANEGLDPAIVLAAVARSIVGKWPMPPANLHQLRLFAAAEAAIADAADAAADNKRRPAVAPITATLDATTVDAAQLNLPPIPGDGTHNRQHLPLDLLGWLREALLLPDTRRESGAHYTPAAVARRLAEITLDADESDADALPVVATTPKLPSVCDPAVGGGAFLLASARVLEQQGFARHEIVTRALWGSDLDELAVAVAEATLALWVCEPAGHDDADLPDPIGAALDAAVTASSVGNSVPAPSSSGETISEVPRQVAPVRVPTLGDSIVVADALVAGPAAWSNRAAKAFDVVIGNPPFVGQLAEATARTPERAETLRARYGDAVQGYTDTAAIFLLAAIDLVEAGGHVAFLQPESFLAVRDGAGCRKALLSRADLVGIWLAREAIFTASVAVCAPIFRSAPNSVATGRIAISRWVGSQLDEQPELKLEAGDLRAAPTWAHLVADLRGVPSSPIRSSGTLGDRCKATAGFRDEYYGLVPVVHDDPGDGTAQHPLVTCGIVDPGLCLWGRRSVRFAGQRFSAPVVDVERLRRDAVEAAAVAAQAAAEAEAAERAAAKAYDAAIEAAIATGEAPPEPVKPAPKRRGRKASRSAVPAAERLVRWVDAQLVPKVVVATQTRVIEAAVDVDGTWVPSVPVVAVVPEPGDLWHVAAALLAPSTTAWAIERYGGTALVSDAVKLSARQVLEVPLPVDQAAWDEGAALLQQASSAIDEDEWRSLLLRFGAAMARSYDLDADDPVVDWWAGRLPSWSKPEVAREMPNR